MNFYRLKKLCKKVLNKLFSLIWLEVWNACIILILICIKLIRTLILVMLHLNKMLMQAEEKMSFNHSSFITILKMHFRQLWSNWSHKLRKLNITWIKINFKIQSWWNCYLICNKRLKWKNKKHAKKIKHN